MYEFGSFYPIEGIESEKEQMYSFGSIQLLSLLNFIALCQISKQATSSNTRKRHSDFEFQETLNYGKNKHQ